MFNSSRARTEHPSRRQTKATNQEATPGLEQTKQSEDFMKQNTTYTSLLLFHYQKDNLGQHTRCINSDSTPYQQFCTLPSHEYSSHCISLHWCHDKRPHSGKVKDTYCHNASTFPCSLYLRNFPIPI